MNDFNNHQSNGFNQHESNGFNQYHNGNDNDYYDGVGNQPNYSDQTMIRPFYDSLHFRKIHVDHKEAKALSDGKTIYSAGVFEKNEKLSVYTDGFFVGVCVYNEGSIKAHKIFNTEII